MGVGYLVTEYNGTTQCTDCGTDIDPVRALYSNPVPRCGSCQRIADDKHLKGMMVS